MKSNSIKTYSLLFGALAFAFVLAVSGTALASTGPDQMLLAKGNQKNAPPAAPKVDNPIKHAPHAPGAVHGALPTGSNVFFAKGKARVPDDNPKPHGPTHNLIEKVAGGDMVLAKNKKPAPVPGAPKLDAPIKNAPHPPGAVHG